MPLKQILMRIRELSQDETDFNFIIGHFELFSNVPLEKVEEISIIREDMTIQLD